MVVVVKRGHMWREGLGEWEVEKAEVDEAGE